MAEGAGFNYVATRVIEDSNGARAYNPGDLVHVSAVEGDGAWLRDGIDVKPRPGMRLDKPAGNASTQAWADYAVSLGVGTGETDSMSRDELRAKYGAGETAPPTPAPEPEPAPESPAEPAEPEPVEEPAPAEPEPSDEGTT